MFNFTEAVLEELGHPQMGGLRSGTRLASIKSVNGLVASSVVSFTDDFNRANAAPMSDPATGGTWTAGPGASNPPKIDSNLLKAGATSTANLARVLTPSFPGDHTATVTIAAGSATTAIGVCVRLQSASLADGYLAYISNGTTVTLNRMVDTGTIAFTQIGSRTVSFATGDTLGLGVVGTDLTIYKNGTAQGAAISDATFSGGQPGVYLSGSAQFVSLFAGT
jgi:hypothetical protein